MYIDNNSCVDVYTIDVQIYMTYLCGSLTALNHQSYNKPAHFIINLSFFKMMKMKNDDRKEKTIFSAENFKKVCVHSLKIMCSITGSQLVVAYSRFVH